MKKIFLLLFISLPILAQTDFTNLSWKFRGPMNYNLGAKEVIDIATDPNNSKKIWACTLEDGLLFNDNIIDEKSNWQKSSLTNRRVYKLKFHPNKPLVAFAIGDFINWKTTDGGKNWTEITQIQGASRCYDIWVSKVGTVVAATKNEVFTSTDEGKTWKEILKLENLSIIKQLWVQENERIYVLKDDNKGLFSDATYSKWSDITLAQMRVEEMPFPELEEFHAYVVQNNEVLHGFTTERRKILARNIYSIDGRQNYQLLLSPENINEIVFAGNDIVFATKKGIMVYKEAKLQERSGGQLAGEYRMLAKKTDAGDNNIVGLSTKGIFLMNSLEKGDAYEAQNQGEYYNSIFTDSKTGFAAVEVDKIKFIGYTHLEGRKIIPLPNNVSLYLTHNGQLGRLAGNIFGNQSVGISSIIETTTIPIIDIYYNENIKTVFCLLRDGRFMTIRMPDANDNTTMVKQIFQFQLPFSIFNEALIEELTADGSQVLISDKTKYLFAIIGDGNGKKLQQINTDALKNLKINHLEYSVKFQKLFLATEKGVFKGENVLSDTPKWTNISKEIGEDPCVFIQLRTLDGQLSVMTRNKGIYTTTLFAEQNQIVTHTPKFFQNFDSPAYFWSGTLSPYICDLSKIKIDFTTNIPPNQGVKYLVEVSDINGNFPSIPFILKGEASQSPVEVEFVKPQDQRANSFRFRVIAQGTLNVVGSSTPLIGVNNDKNFTHETIKKTLQCENESVELIPSRDIDAGSYIWQKGDVTIASTPHYKAAEAGVYKRTVVINGCNVTSAFEVTTASNGRPLLKPNIGLSHAGNICVVDSFKLFTDFKLGYKYVWYRDDLVMNNVNSADIFVKDKSKYKILVTNQDGCSSISEEIQLKTCDNGQENRAVILNPPTIKVDKKSIYPFEKAMLSVETCDNVNLQWLKNDQRIVGANQKISEVNETGNYVLQIEKFGCTATTNTIKISVETVLGADEENPNFNIDVYPNPFEERLFVSIPAQINTPIDVKMTDISGKFIESYDFSASNNQFIDLKSLQVGVYLLVFDMQGKRVVKKIIKNN